MKFFYIATRLERADDHNRLRDALTAAGWQITYDWTAHGHVWRDGPERIREVSIAELEGVTTADAVIVLLPGGRGTHAELGAALAAGCPVVLHSLTDPLVGPETCAFYHHPLVTSVVAPLEDLARRVCRLPIQRRSRVKGGG